MSKLTIGIVTINDYTNYGNRLQNYALTKLLEMNGCKVVNSIQVHTKEDWCKITNNPIKRLLKHCVPFPIIKNRIYSSKKIDDALLLKRQETFKDFMLRYMQIIDPVIVTTNSAARRALKKYNIDYYIVGSDQVWNPYYEGKAYEFLTFVPKDRRLSFAASIGASAIPEEKKKQYRKNLLDMNYLSVRELQAAEIIENLTGRKADVTLDPTLLLEREEWEKIVQIPNLKLEEKYICAYFLGEIPDAVNKFVKEKNLKVYYLNLEREPELFVLNPAEFLYMIKNASLVLTDSFHAVAISIKFHREFYVFDRQQTGVNNMFTRIESITRLLGLEDRIQSRKEIIEKRRIGNWGEIDKTLDLGRENSIGKLLQIIRK